MSLVPWSLADWEQLLLLSPRNTSTVNAALLSQTTCTKLLYSAELAQPAAKLQEGDQGLKTVQVATLEEMFKREGTHLPFLEKFPEVKGKPILILHSSGSTGKPGSQSAHHPSIVLFEPVHVLSYRISSERPLQ